MFMLQVTENLFKTDLNLKWDSMVQIHVCLLVQFDAAIPGAIRPLFPYASLLCSFALFVHSILSLG